MLYLGDAEPSVALVELVVVGGLGGWVCWGVLVGVGGGGRGEEEGRGWEVGAGG